MLSGMDVSRLNFSHGSLAEHKKYLDTINILNKKYSRHIRILGDLEGYRIRIGKLKKELPLRKKQTLLLTNDPDARAREAIPFDYKGPLGDIKKGCFIYIDDGNIALKVTSVTKQYLVTEVTAPGILKEHKGMNIPDIRLKFRGLTDKDRLGIKFSVENKIDYIAQSFVRSKQDILCFRDMVKDALPGCKIIAKIENRQGIRNIDEIMAVCDGIMVARGDMGVSLPIYEIAIIQKMIIRKCNAMKKFVITATQMLESMTENPRPTRAEVTDVSNAIFDGSDFLMLSGETAAGKYPVESVDMMNKIIKFTESHIND